LAAKDVSMAGLLGSLAMLLEPTGTGVVVDLERLPKPTDVALAEWTAAFPSYGFLLCAPAGREDECVAAFEADGLVCAEIGVLDDTGRLRGALGDERSELLDVARDGATKLKGEGPRTAPRQSSI
jgi:selenophosphate synthetase-related protein